MTEEQVDGYEMVDEDITAEELTDEESVSFDFQAVLDALQNQWASDYARTLLRDAQVIAQNGTLRRMLAEARSEIASKDAVIEELLGEKDLRHHAEAAVASDPSGFLAAR